MSKATCSVEGCEKRTQSRGWCAAHYYRWRKRGTTGTPGLERRPADYPYPLLGNRETRCWEWPGWRSPAGYGHVRWDGRQGTPHRFVYEAIYGAIPPGMMVLHRCDNPPCCNPDHLFLGTHADNMADMVAKARPALGERNANAKLTENDVRAIRRKRAEGQTFPSLAVEFGISLPQAQNVVYRKQWRHVV